MTDLPLFGRQYQVAISSPDATQTVALYGNIGTSPLQGVTGASQASALRIVFDITRNVKDTPNKGTVQITNMAPSTRRAIRPGLNVKLVVGYTNQTQLLFDAGVFSVKTERNVAETLTTMELLDGDGAIFGIGFDATYAAKTPIKKIFADIIAKLATPTPTTPRGVNTGFVSGIPDGTINNAYSPTGSIRTTLNDLCRNYGLEWSIQNNSLQILPIVQHMGFEDGDLVNKHTGMLGTPSFDGTLLTVTTLINPRLQPGRLIKVESLDINGTFKIRGGKWGGDSHGDQWAAELECIPLAATAQALATNFGKKLKDVTKDTKKATKTVKKQSNKAAAAAAAKAAAKTGNL